MKTYVTAALALFLLFISASNSFCSVTGKAFLQGETDHSGIKVNFIPHSATAKADSCYTSSDGSYEINLSGGIYQVMFSKEGFLKHLYNNFDKIAIAENELLNAITLIGGNAIEVGGSVEGIWESKYIYIIMSETYIENGKSLIIEPGTLIKFRDGQSMTAYGKLIAIGTNSEPIVFTTNSKTKSPGLWYGIKVQNDSTVFENCIIECCDNCIYAPNANFTIIKSKIRNFTNYGIYLEDNEPIIKNNEIYDFKSSYGYGIIIINNLSEAVIECNSIYNGIIGISSCGECIFRNNSISNMNLCGVSLTDNYTQTTFQNNFVSDCKTGILTSSYLNINILNNTIIRNEKGIISNSLLNVIIANNIFFSNNSAIFSNIKTDKISISNNLLWQTSADNYFNIDIVGLGKIVTKNKNGHDIDSYFNLYQDPLFIDNTPPFLSANSPCIGAGNPEYSENIGFDSTGMCPDILTSVPFYPVMPKTADNAVNYPNPCTISTNIEFILQNDSHVRIEIYDITGNMKSVAFEKHFLSGRNVETVSLIDFTPGMYYYLIKTDSKVISGKFIKE